MDKNKSVEEIKQLVEKKQYSRALEKLERMDMQTELTEGDLAVFAEVYICNKQFAKAKALLEVMFNNNATKKLKTIVAKERYNIVSTASVSILLNSGSTKKARLKFPN